MSHNYTMAAARIEPLRGTDVRVPGLWHAMRAGPFSSWNRRRLGQQFESPLRGCQVRGRQQGQQEHGCVRRCGDYTPVVRQAERADLFVCGPITVE